MSRVLPAPVSPISSMCCPSALCGIRMRGFDSSVLKPTPLPLTALLKLLRRYQYRPFQKPTVLHFLEPFHILARSKDERSKKGCKAREQWPAQSAEDALAVVNEALKVGMERPIAVDSFRAYVQVNETGGARGVR